MDHHYDDNDYVNNDDDDYDKDDDNDEDDDDGDDGDDDDGDGDDKDETSGLGSLTRGTVTFCELQKSDPTPDPLIHTSER